MSDNLQQPDPREFVPSEVASDTARLDYMQAICTICKQPLQLDAAKLHEGIWVHPECIPPAPDERERRRYALLAVAVDVFNTNGRITARLDRAAHLCAVDVVIEMLAEIERREREG